MATDGLQKLKLIFHQELDIEKRKKNRIITDGLCFLSSAMALGSGIFYLRVFGAEPRNVIVDQVEDKSSVHEGQTSLWKGIKVNLLLRID